MPTYDYKCTACEHRYEMREGFDAPPRQNCPVCGGLAKRVLHAPPIVFKGSGFYITDSRKGSQVTLGDASGPAMASAETKESAPAKTESAPATPASPTPASTD